jgi:hypothetical protein
VSRSRTRCRRIWRFISVSADRWPAGYPSSRSRDAIDVPYGGRNRQRTLVPPSISALRSWSAYCWHNRLSERPAASIFVASANSRCVEVKTAQGLLGHSDSRLTLDHYAQVVTELSEAAAAAMGARFFQAPARDGRAMEAGSGVNGDDAQTRREGL